MALPKEVEEEIKKSILTAEAQIKDLEPEVARAKRAGIDVSEDEARLARLKEQVYRLKAEFGK